jgi:hypothetical protein
VVLVGGQGGADLGRRRHFKDPDLRRARSVQVGDRVEQGLHLRLDIQRCTVGACLVRGGHRRQNLQRPRQRRCRGPINTTQTAAEPNPGHRGQQPAVGRHSKHLNGQP